MSTASECVCCREICEICEVFQKLNEFVHIFPASLTILDLLVSVSTFGYYRQPTINIGRSIEKRKPHYHYMSNNHYKHQYLVYLSTIVLYTHRKYRYVSYRQMIRWCWGWLGRSIRVVLPSCAVMKIRDTFPSETYTGFQYPTL
jgi:hypothetical protein